MRLAFWSAVALIAYTYLGYPAWLRLRAGWRSRPISRSPYTPFVSVVLVVRNEARVIGRKLRNLLFLDYPDDLYEIIVVSDGSADGTNDILAQYATDARLRPIIAPPRGKAAGLNDAIQAARGSIIVFTDARQKIDPDAVQLLMQNFSDSTIGCASGQLMLGDPDLGECSEGVGLYWRIEKAIREWESASGSVVGATGAMYAVRRELFSRVPPETILDDVYVPMNVVRQNQRVVLDMRARAWDIPETDSTREFHRKVRTLTGNYQLLQLSPWLLTTKNPILFEFVSHKLLRLLVPFALVSAFVSSVFLTGPIYRIALLLQLCFYAMSCLALFGLRRGPLARAADASLTFVLLNAAAAVAFGKFISGRKPVWS